MWLEGVAKPSCTLACPDPSDVPFGVIYIMPPGRDHVYNEEERRIDLNIKAKEKKQKHIFLYISLQVNLLHLTFIHSI